MTTSQKNSSVSNLSGSGKAPPPYYPKHTPLDKRDDNVVDSNTLSVNRVSKFKILITSLVLFMIIDYSTKTWLFQLSVRHSQIMREYYQSYFYDKFFHLVSELGDKYAVGIIIYLSYNVLDHPKAFIVILEAIICQAFSCILKAIYHEPRPFFVADLKPNVCRFEYGNPSGHSFISFGLYLTLWDLICRQYKVSPLLKKLTLIPLIIMALTIGFSRLYNGVHTYNQVFSGFTWGILTYFACCHVFYFEICVFVNRIGRANITLRELVWNSITQIFVVAYAASVALFFFNQAMHPTPDEWLQAIEKNCPSTQGVHIEPEVSNFIQFNFAWGLLGAYLGLIIEQRVLQTQHYPYFFKTSIGTTLKRIVFCSPPAIVTQLPVLLISKKNPFWVVLILKTMMPIMLGCLYIFGFTKLVGMKFGLINTEIMSKKDLIQEEESREEIAAGKHQKSSSGGRRKNQ